MSNRPLVVVADYLVEIGVERDLLDAVAEVRLLRLSEKPCSVAGKTGVLE